MIPNAKRGARRPKFAARIVLATIISLLTLGAPAVHASEQQVDLAGLKVTVWSADSPSAVARNEPVIIFSHGFHGCAVQSRFLTEAMASAGYLVFAPNHRDAACGGGAGSWTQKSAVPFGKPDNWSDTTYRDRADDIRNLIQAIRTDERFRTRADLSRLGLVGHSLGGYTVLGLGGAWPSWKLEGVKAVLALSPYDQPFIAHKTLGGLSAPVMYQGGTRDIGITPSIEKAAGGYDQSPAPKYFVEFDKAGHFAWTNLTRTDHDAIAAYAVAFLNHYVRGDPAAPILTHASDGVVALRYASDLGTSGPDKSAAAHESGVRGKIRERLMQRLHPAS